MTELRTWLQALVMVVVVFLVAEAGGFLVGAFLDGLCRASPTC